MTRSRSQSRVRGSMPAAAAGPESESAAAPTSATGRVAKATIPRALREQVWIHYAGRVFERKCLIRWCSNTMTVFDFHVGHDVPESVGGATELANLRPICARCNLSMGAGATIAEWSRLSAPVRRTWWRWATQCVRAR